MPMYGRRPSGRAGPRSTRTTRYSAKRRRGGLKRSATRTTKAPVSTGYSRQGGLKTQYTMRQVSDTCVRITGRSYLGTVNNASVSSGNAIGLLYDVNPSLLGDRVAVMASTYDKYCYQTMKFTYVPQCPTSQPGSVMLVFERDAEAPCANTTSNSYMQEVMSYEHAVLTPAWVSTSVTYKRDPHEVKTWFMGGDQATLSARETSQGTFIAYTSNAPPQGQTETVTNVPAPTSTSYAYPATQTITGSLGGAAGKLGFVVMDFVLDLVSPNILPNKVTTLGNQQYFQAPNFGLENVSTSAMAVDQYQQEFWPIYSPSGSIAQIPGISTVVAGGCASGTILEIVLDGTTGLNSNNNQSITANLGYYEAGGIAPNQVLSSGSRFYLTLVQSFNPGTTLVPIAQTGNVAIWFATATLADAIAVAGINGATSKAANVTTTNTYQTVAAALACGATQWGANNIITQQNAFIRILSNPKASRSTA